MEFPSSLSRDCHKHVPLVPETRAERVACAATAAVGAAILTGLPAIMSVLHLGGVW